MRTCVIVLTLFLAGCGPEGGGSSADSTPAVQTVTRYHPSGRIQETGAVITASGKRTGVWTAYHDLGGSPLRFTGEYADGMLDTGKAWTEWNADGSVRADAGDR
jgi:hypothetical protein